MNESLNMRLQTMKSNGRSGKIRENLSGQLAFFSFVPTDLQDIRIQYTDEMVRISKPLGRRQDTYSKI